jgi:hypothetical protein
MHRGAALARCDWAAPTDWGIDISFTRTDGALALSSLACLRARLRFEEGHAAEAVEDVAAALTLARHVSQDGTLDGLWAGYQIEQRAGEALALSLPKLDAKAVRDLTARLNALPPGGSVAAATLRMEDTLLDWIGGEVREASDPESLLAFLTQLGGFKADAPETRRAKGRALLEACGGTAPGVLKLAEQMRPSCAPLAKALDRPPDQAAREFDREAAKLAGNPVFKVFAPALDNVRARRARADVRRALLSAALAVRLDGQGALKDHPDPVTGGPFEYAAFDGGFELCSKLKQDDVPLALTVGQRGP